jgi:cyclic pyranopterin phosphate synthase
LLANFYNGKNVLQIAVGYKLMALDHFGRRIHYLRISLTDHCNLRCIYCMPDDMSFRPTAELMQDDEIVPGQVFARLGLTNFALTGGEPTNQGGVVDLVRIAHTRV